MTYMTYKKTKSLKVLLIGNYAADQQQSMLGFASAMLSGLCARGVEARLLTPRQVVGRFGSSHRGIGKWLGYIDKFGLFPRELRRALDWANVVHICDQGNAMYVKHLRQIPHVLTCNDLMAVRAARGEMPGWTVGRTGRLYQKLILAGISKAQQVTCISETTRQDLHRLSHLPPSRTSVLYDGLLHPYSPMPAAESIAVLDALGLKTQRPFLLHVGGNQPYKNREGVLKIFAALQNSAKSSPNYLVLAGKPLMQEMWTYIHTQGMAKNIMELTGPTNEQLRALYSCAQALVFPSLYEGFGLPIIEAQACGCPVFTSDRAPMTEVGGDAAVYFDPTQHIEAAQIIAERLAQPGATDAMRIAGLENVQRFTLEKMLDGYQRVYERVLSEGWA